MIKNDEHLMKLVIASGGEINHLSEGEVFTFTKEQLINFKNNNGEPMKVTLPAKISLLIDAHGDCC